MVKYVNNKNVTLSIMNVIKNEGANKVWQNKSKWNDSRYLYTRWL